MSPTHRLDVTPSGTHYLDLNAPDVPAGLLGRLWADATHFALVSHGAKGLMKKAAPLRSLIEDVWEVSEWPGTQTGGQVFWLHGRVAGPAPFPLDEATVWHGWGGWDDLQLYKGKAVQLYVCSHEGFGAAWASERLFHQLGLQAKPSAGAAKYQVVGTPIEREQLARLRGVAPPDGG